MDSKDPKDLTPKRKSTAVLRIVPSESSILPHTNNVASSQTKFKSKFAAMMNVLADEIDIEVKTILRF